MTIIEREEREEREEEEEEEGGKRKRISKQDE